MNRHHYYIDIHWNFSRKGIICSPDLTARQAEQGCIEVATPPQFPKGIPGIWSPEHLLTASVSSCFMTTFLAVAENSKLDFQSFDCRATGVLEQLDGQYLMTEIRLEPKLVINNANDHDRALRILEKTEKNCLISRSIKSKITLHPRVEVRPRATAEPELLVN